MKADDPNLNKGAITFDPDKMMLTILCETDDDCQPQTLEITITGTLDDAD